MESVPYAKPADQTPIPPRFQPHYNPVINRPPDSPGLVGTPAVAGVHSESK
jgi:hypothetical protein